MNATAPPPATNRVCIDCDNAYFSDRLFSPRCNECQDQFDAALVDTERKVHRQASERKWLEALQRFESASLAQWQSYFLHVEPEVKKEVDAWILRDLPGMQRGLGIIGPVGSGKTVSATQCLYYASRQGRSIAITSDPRITTLVTTVTNGNPTDKASAVAELKELEKADVLLLDDLGHSCRGGNLAQRELFRIIHTRAQANRLNIWTAQGGSRWLAL